MEGFVDAFLDGGFVAAADVGGGMEYGVDVGVEDVGGVWI